MNTKISPAQARGVADITVLWQGALLDVVRIGRGERYSLPAGTEPNNEVPLVHVDDDGVRITPSEHAMLVAPQVPPSVREVRLPAREVARVVSGDLAFLIRYDDRHRPAASTRRLDRRLLTISSVTMILQVALLIAVALAPTPEHSDDPKLLRSRSSVATLRRLIPPPVIQKVPAPAAPALERAVRKAMQAQVVPAPPARARRRSARARSDARARDAVRNLFAGGGAPTGLFASLDGSLNTLAGDAGGGGGRGRRGARGLGDGGDSLVGIGDKLRGGGTPDGDIGPLDGHRGRRLEPTQKIVHRDGLERGEIARVVRRHLSQVRHCYERALSKDPGLSGRVEVAWTIAASGRVRTVTLDDATPQALGSCLKRVVQRMRFEQPRGEGEVFVRWPFVFSLAGR